MRPHLEQLIRNAGRDAETSSRIFAIGHDQIDSLVLDNISEMVRHNTAARRPHNIANKKSSQCEDW